MSWIGIAPTREHETGKPSTDLGLLTQPTRWQSSHRCSLYHTATSSDLTVTADELTAPRRGLVAALQHSLPRNELFAGLYILGCVNGLPGAKYLHLQLGRGRDAVVGFEINVIALAACFAGVYLIASNSQDRIRALDLVVTLAFLGLVTVPIYALSWVAVTGFSLYILFFANDGCERRRGALILLALSRSYAVEPARRNHGGVVAGYRAHRLPTASLWSFEAGFTESSQLAPYLPTSLPRGRLPPLASSPGRRPRD
jgi:hypothetical protein